VTITTPGNILNTINNWANPNFGTTTNGLRLTQVMSSIRWTGVPGIFTINLSGLQVGTYYQLQLLFIESLSDRVFNVTVNDTPIVPNFRLLDYGPTGTSIVIPYVFAATSTNALLQLGGGSGGSDNNPQMSGFTLETLISVTPPSFSSVTQSGTNLIFSVTNGVPGTGWTCLTTTNLAPPVIWSTNRTGTFDGQGNVTVTNGILSTEPARYFIIRAP
jgi:hypothetical protein